MRRRSRRPSRKVLPEALERIIRLYESWGKDADAAEWRKKRGSPG